MLTFIVGIVVGIVVGAVTCLVLEARRTRRSRLATFYGISQQTIDRTSK